MAKMAGMLLLSLVVSTRALTYGPAECVSLSQSAQGTCVINTNCEGQNTSAFEFAFDCFNKGAAKNQIQRHSFGEGGFDDVEEFDTEVKCERCERPGGIKLVKQPAPGLKVAKVEADTASHPPKAHVVQAVLPGAAHSLVAAAASSEATSATASESTKVWPFSDSKAPVKAVAASSKVVSFGPSDCVSTYKNADKHCVMQTNCDDVKKNDAAAWSGYEFGLICVDKTGVPVRHIFGKDSFDSTETFDTLIVCDQCMGLDDVSEDVALTGQVVVLADEIKSISGMVKDVNADVLKLNDKVFPKPAANNTNVTAANKTAEAKAPAENAKALAHAESKTQTVKQHLRKSKKAHRHHRHAANDEDSDAEVEEEQAPAKKHNLRRHARKQARKHVQHKQKHRHEQEESEDNEHVEADEEEQGEEELEEAEAGDEDQDTADEDEAVAPASPEDDDISHNDDTVVTAVVKRKHHARKTPLSHHRRAREEDGDGEAEDTEDDQAAVSADDEEATDEDVTA